MKKSIVISVALILCGISFFMLPTVDNTVNESSVTHGDEDVRMPVKGLIATEQNSPAFVSPWKSWNDADKNSASEEFRKWLLKN